MFGSNDTTHWKIHDVLFNCIAFGCAKCSHSKDKVLVQRYALQCLKRAIYLSPVENLTTVWPKRLPKQASHLAIRRMQSCCRNGLRQRHLEQPPRQQHKVHGRQSEH